MKILVTGGAGFIGSAVVRHIIQHTQDSVVNLDKLTYAGNLESLAAVSAREGANKRGNSSRLTQSFHFFMFEPIFSPVNALNQPI